MAEGAGDMSRPESSAHLVRVGTAESRLFAELQEIQSENATRPECGFLNCRPVWLQKCANTKLFTATLCIVACINGSIASSYLPSVITTIEKRFELTSSISGLIVSSYEIGAIIAVILVSYLGEKRHIPLIVGSGTVLVGIGTCLFSLPHFVTSSYTLTIQSEVNRSASDLVCQLNSARQEDQCLEKSLVGHTGQIAIFVTALILVGVGSAPILTLGLGYIDSHVTKKQSPQYLAFVYAASTVGPVIGFGCGAAVLEVYVDIIKYTAKAVGITSSDSNWVGAWWLGFILFGTLTILSAIPLFCFPKSLKQEKTKLIEEKLKYLAEEGPAKFSIAAAQEEEEPDSGVAATSIGKSLKDFPKALLEICKNPIFMLTNLGSTFEMLIVTGFLTFVPKYFETQFDVKASSANLFTGGIAIPGAVLGIIFMGVIMKKYKLELKGAIHMVLILNLFTLASFSLAFFLGCPNLEVAGVTVPFQHGADPRYMDDRNSPIKRPIQSNLTHTCNAACDCLDTKYNPVCGWNNVTFFSACFAGCKTHITQLNDGEEEVIYGECDCVEQPLNGTLSSTISVPDLSVTAGACSRDCNMLIPYMVLLGIISFTLAGAKTPITVITLRSVKSDLRSFGLGFQVMIIRLFALLPAPIIFGKIIDTTCLYWKVECGKQKNCLLHDVEEFRYKFAGVSAGLHVLAMLSFLGCMFVIKRRANQEENQPTSVQPKVEIYSIDSSMSGSTGSSGEYPTGIPNPAFQSTQL